MALFQRAMEYYPYVFHPITVLGAGILLLIHYEWDRQDAGRAMLWRRVGGFLGAGVLSLIPTAAYMLARGTGVSGTTKGHAWQVDALVAVGLFIAAGVTWFLWRYFGWGSLVPDAMQTLTVATVPYAVLSPVWDISGHVLIALVPTLYLTLVDRTFWPLLAIPVVMIPNRVVLDAHTWTQSVAGFLVAGVIVVGTYWLQTGTLNDYDTRATAP